jgi:hypothetical protein
MVAVILGMSALLLRLCFCTESWCAARKIGFDSSQTVRDDIRRIDTFSRKNDDPAHGHYLTGRITVILHHRFYCVGPSELKEHKAA